MDGIIEKKCLLIIKIHNTSTHPYACFNFLIIAHTKKRKSSNI